MQKTPRKAITSEQWDQAAADYELGYKHAAQIAREFQVSPATVSREFKRRGCVKACRIAETTAEIEARLDAEAEEQAKARATADAERKEAVGRLIDELFNAFDEAREAGEPLGGNAEVARIGKALQLALS